MKLYSMSFFFYFIHFIHSPYFNLLYEAIFYVLKFIIVDWTLELIISIFFMKLYSMSSRMNFLKTMCSNIFQSSLWSYILCPIPDFIVGGIEDIDFNLLYEAIFYVLEDSNWIILGNYYISIFFMKLYSMSCKLYFFKSNSWNYISIFFMKLYSMSFELGINCDVVIFHFNLLYEAIFYVLQSTK